MSFTGNHSSSTREALEDFEILEIGLVYFVSANRLCPLTLGKLAQSTQQ